jgi:hypothetical protein
MKAMLLFFSNKDNKFGVLEKGIVDVEQQFGSTMASAKRKKVKKRTFIFCLKLFWVTSKNNLFPPYHCEHEQKLFKLRFFRELNQLN